MKHIHGYCDSTILTGVNDIEQIANSSFRSSSSLRRVLVKPAANDSMETLISEECSRLIDRANYIVMFGLSFGRTDSMWWDNVSRNLNSNDRRVVIFDYGKDVDIRHNQFLLGEYRETTIKKIIPNLDQSRTSHVFYALNSDMFSSLTNIYQED